MLLHKLMTGEIGVGGLGLADVQALHISAGFGALHVVTRRERENGQKAIRRQNVVYAVLHGGCQVLGFKPTDPSTKGCIESGNIRSSRQA